MEEKTLSAHSASLTNRLLSLYYYSERRPLLFVVRCSLFTQSQMDDLQIRNSTFSDFSAEENLLVNNKNNRVYMSRNYKCDSYPLRGIWRF